MKKILFTLIFSVVTLVAHAQDVIQKLDGSYINAKVLEIANDEIKYKKFDNQDGPTYSINKSLVSIISYENGSVEEIAKILNVDANIKKAKTLKKMSFIIGGGMVLGGMILGLSAKSNYDKDPYNEDADYYYNTKTGWGYALMGAGAATGAIMYFSGRNIEKKTNRYQTSALEIKDFQFDNGTNLIADLDLFNDSQCGSKSIGFGVRFNF